MYILQVITPKGNTVLFEKYTDLREARIEFAYQHSKNKKNRVFLRQSIGNGRFRTISSWFRQDKGKDRDMTVEATPAVISQFTNAVSNGGRYFKNER